MRRAVYSHEKVNKESDNFIWIVIDPNDDKNAKWTKKYKYKVMPSARFCYFNGKSIAKIEGACTTKPFLSALKKLKRKNKSAWKKESKKREKEAKKKEEEAKEKEEKEDKDKDKDEDKDK